MTNINLYHVQDSDRPMWVIGTCYGHAVMRWKMIVAKENDMEWQDVDEPQGVHFICDSNELLLPDPDEPTSSGSTPL